MEKPEYGLYKKPITDDRTVWLAKVPLPISDAKSQRYISRRFSTGEHPNAYLDARQWRDEMGEKLWGCMWPVIISNGGLKQAYAQRVWLYSGHTTSHNRAYKQFVVEWFENNSRHSKVFSPKRFQTLANAYLAAALYALDKESRLRSLPLDSPLLKTRKYLSKPERV